jgi:hypothetical protein
MHSFTEKEITPVTVCALPDTAGINLEEGG